MGKNKKRRFGVGKFALGTLVGVGVGMLLSKKTGKENREALKERLEYLKEQVNKIDKEEVKRNFQDKILEIQDDFEDLDKEKAAVVAKKYATNIKNKTEELVSLAIEKGTPVVRDAADQVREKAVVVAKDVIDRLEKKEDKPKKAEKTVKSEKKQD